jgi:hypothetical protein
MLAADSLGTDSQCRHAELQLFRTASWTMAAQKDRQNGGMSETILKLFLANGSTERQTKWRPVRNYSELLPDQWQHAASYRKTDKMAACRKLFRAAS